MNRLCTHKLTGILDKSTSAQKGEVAVFPDSHSHKIVDQLERDWVKNQKIKIVPEYKILSEPQPKVRPKQKTVRKGMACPAGNHIIL